MCAVSGRVQANERHPLVDQARILPGCEVAATLHAAWKQPIVRSKLLGFDPGCNRSSGVLSHFELHRPSRLLLKDHDAPLHAACRHQIRDPELNEITTA